jgi:hypothetical protein
MLNTITTNSAATPAANQFTDPKNRIIENLGADVRILNRRSEELAQENAELKARKRAPKATEVACA